MTAEVPFIDLAAQHRELRPALLKVVSDALESGQFAGGREVERFETAFAAFGGYRHVVAVANGTDALRIALQAMGIAAGARVVTVPNTFIATTEAITHAGAAFEFVDIDPATCLMDVNRLEDLLQDAFERRPKAERPVCVLPVHLYGQPADMDGIGALAARYEFKVLEDAAQAHGATYKERAAGSLGNAAAFSFYPAKNLGACGEAGAITTNDAMLAERARMLRDHGQAEKYLHRIEGANSRMDAIQAGFLRVKLGRLAEWNAARHRIAAQYDAAFGSMSGIERAVVLPHNLSSHHLYVIHVDRRDALREFLLRRGIQTGMHYPVPLHLQECYRPLGIAAGSFACAERSAERLVSLPLYPEMAQTQVEAVIRGVTEFVAAC